MEQGAYQIADAARASGVSARLIRHYESRGLIPAPHRGANGYRYYQPRDIERLRFVHRARNLGFSLAQIRQLLDLWQNRQRSSQEVKRLALSHIAELEAKIRELEDMRNTLRHLADHCQGNDRPDCPILDDLAGQAEPHAASNKGQ
ncbi:Cu(I)-responsive transcriptional regulator [Natronospira proteinivora]|uniref:Cu(I)-responsive transcriptional regulator n=1 Tax=Natronospira proteinivora TaxID=1807133 RepID=A0ABT1G8E5_9GAMM|nr:Cu(I)-responsive transcriptional regulator [Natronospira proteinivora]MCP1727560.1 Cu(I)-responsive transcriptional regulator [Natronospira proteinivora]